MAMAAGGDNSFFALTVTKIENIDSVVSEVPYASSRFASDTVKLKTHSA